MEYIHNKGYFLTIPHPKKEKNIIAFFLFYIYLYIKKLYSIFLPFSIIKFEKLSSTYQLRKNLSSFLIYKIYHIFPLKHKIFHTTVSICQMIIWDKMDYSSIASIDEKYIKIIYGFSHSISLIYLIISLHSLKKNNPILSPKDLIIFY